MGAWGLERMRDHRKLDVFHLADTLVVAVYRETAAFPRSEAFGLVSQMRRSAVSVTANIVEGCARRTENDYVRFLEIAFGSLRELGYYLDLSVRLGFLDSQRAADMNINQGRTAAALTALIRARRAAEGR